MSVRAGMHSGDKSVGFYPVSERSFARVRLGERRSTDLLTLPLGMPHKVKELASRLVREPARQRGSEPGLGLRYRRSTGQSSVLRPPSGTGDPGTRRLGRGAKVEGPLYVRVKPALVRVETAERRLAGALSCARLVPSASSDSVAGPHATLSPSQQRGVRESLVKYTHVYHCN